jgi:magnesium-transporting ATPase (P-type)
MILVVDCVQLAHLHAAGLAARKPEPGNPKGAQARFTEFQWNSAHKPTAYTTHNKSRIESGLFRGLDDENPWPLLSRFVFFVMIQTFVTYLDKLAFDSRFCGSCNMMDETIRQQSSVFRNFFNTVILTPLRFVLLPFYYWLCFWYVTLPMAVFQCIWNAHVMVVTRRSQHIRQLILHSQRIWTIRKFASVYFWVIILLMIVILLYRSQCLCTKNIFHEDKQTTSSCIRNSSGGL